MTTLKNILVHVDDDPACGARLDRAIELAGEFDAHLTGLHILHPLALPTYAQYGHSPDAWALESQIKAARASADAAQASFRQVEDAAGIAAEWRCVEGDKLAQLIAHGRHTDLVIVGQTTPNEEPVVYTAFADRLILELGRPVLVIPYNATSQKIGQRVLVAWNGSREAARAVNDALPILRRADYVQVFSIDPEDIDSGQRLSGADICQHLARHDVNVEASAARASDMKVGDRLNAQVANEAFDLVVMGGYGHTRFRETAMGGVTRALLRHMIVPVFLSH